MNAYLIGKGEDCDLRITDDEYVSTRHARIWQESGVVWLEDEGSTNGTFVNERRIWGKSPVVPGDVIRVGRTKIPWTTDA